MSEGETAWDVLCELAHSFYIGELSVPEAGSDEHISLVADIATLYTLSVIDGSNPIVRKENLFKRHKVRVVTLTDEEAERMIAELDGGNYA